MPGLLRLHRQRDHHCQPGRSLRAAEAQSGLEAQLKKAGGRVGTVEAAARIQTLRDLHMKMDQAVLAAYGCTDISLGHGFSKVDFLPENDRVRFTISPAARREVLKSLLELNHSCHAEEKQTEENRLRKNAAYRI